MQTFHLKIIACNRIFFDGEAESLVFPCYDGVMEVLAHHAKMTAPVEIGEIKYRLPGEDWQSAVVSDGLIEVHDNEVTVIAYSVERPEEIDVFRAEAAKERATEQLSQEQSAREHRLSSAALARALARLQMAGKKKYE